MFMDIMCSIIGPVLVSTLIMLLTGNQQTDYWYDFYHSYYKFPKESTDSIDRLLVRSHPTKAKIGMMKIITPDHFIPDQGNHYFYSNILGHRGLNFLSEQGPVDFTLTLLRGYIGLHKKREIIGSSEIYTYIAWVSPFNKNLINDFNRQIMENKKKESINVFVTDTTTIEPQLLQIEKSYKSPNHLQKTMITKILEHWKNPTSYNNTKVFLHGRSGSGKTYTAYGLKKTIEMKYNTSVMLFDDFNPSVIGISILKILSNAHEDTPVIIVVNEVDIAYKKVLSGDQIFDPRGSYTKDKISFNNMLDYISSIMHVIIIFTCEKSPEQLLEENPNYNSFLREGRIDLFLEMKEQNCTFLTDGEE